MRGNRGRRQKPEAEGFPCSFDPGRARKPVVGRKTPVFSGLLSVAKKDFIFQKGKTGGSAFYLEELDIQVSSIGKEIVILKTREVFDRALLYPRSLSAIQ